MATEESALFQPVGRWCSGTVHACPPETSVDAAARRMRELSISSLIVAEAPEHPLGILTDRDLRQPRRRGKPPAFDPSPWPRS